MSEPNASATSQANGTAPPAGGDQQDPGQQPGPSPAGEKILGFIGAGIGALLLGIGIDLMTGGALSRMLGLGEVSDDDQPG